MANNLPRARGELGLGRSSVCPFFSSVRSLATSSVSRDDNNNNKNGDPPPPLPFHSGPSLQLGIGTLARHTHASVVAQAGGTIVLSTVARSSI